MAALLALCLPPAARWSRGALATALADPACFAFTRGAEALALGREIAGEAELLTLAVAPAGRRAGTGAALLAAFEAEARTRGARDAFLEVADDNAPARALYARAGWREVGRRPGYYAGVDALTLHKALAADERAPG